MFCPNCGTKAGDGMRFCPACGAKLPESVSAPSESSIAASPAPSGGQSAPSAPASPAGAQNQKKPPSRAAVGVIIAALLVVIVLLIALLARGDGTDGDAQRTDSSGQSASASLPPEDTSGSAASDDPASDDPASSADPASSEGGEPAGGPAVPTLEDADIEYQDVLLNRLVGLSMEEVEVAFGAPTGGTPVTGELLFGGTPFWVYNDTLSVWFDEYFVWSIHVRADAAVLNGSPLALPRAGLIALLGEPRAEGMYVDEMGETGDYYYMQYSIGGAAAEFTMPSADDAADTITLSSSFTEYGGGYSGGGEDAVLPAGFEWVEPPELVIDDWGFQSIRGVVRNVSGAAAENVNIRFSVYDEEGYRLTDAHDHIGELGDGESWKFSATCPSVFASYTFKELVTF